VYIKTKGGTDEEQTDMFYATDRSIGYFNAGRMRTGDNSRTDFSREMQRFLWEEWIVIHRMRTEPAINTVFFHTFSGGGFHTGGTEGSSGKPCKYDIFTERRNLFSTVSDPSDVQGASQSADSEHTASVYKSGKYTGFTVDLYLGCDQWNELPASGEYHADAVLYAKCIQTA
jgi:hypothetical protein